MTVSDAVTEGGPGDAIPPAPAGDEGGRIVRHANLMSVLTILSRFAGLVRDKTWSYFLGAQWEFSAFWMGFQFPNLSRRIFGEGALTAAFVPLYTELLHKRGQAGANAFVSGVVSLLVMVLGILTIAGEAVAVPLALLPHGGLNFWDDHNRVAAAMIAVMLPYCVMICLVAILGAAATVHERFTAQSLNPIILNLVAAGGAALCAWVMTSSYPIEKRIFWVAFSVLLAGILQVALMLPTVWKSGVRLRPVLGMQAWRAAGLGPLLVSFLPIMLGSSAVQINTFMDTQIAWWLSPDGHNGNEWFTFLGHSIHTAMGKGAGAKLSMAQRIYLLPVGIFGVSMAMAVFPPMARAAAAGDREAIKRLLVAGLRKTLFLSIPSSLGMILAARPLLVLVYQGGKVQPEDVDRAYWASIFFCVGIWAFEAQMVILRVFFVLKDTRTPTVVSLLMIVLNFGLNLTLVWFLREGGIALSTTLAAIVQGTILLLLLRRRLGALGLRGLAGNILKSSIATVVMVEVGWLISAIGLPGDAGIGTAGKVMVACKLAALVAVCGGIYVGLTRFLGMPEVLDVPLIGRFLRPKLGADERTSQR